MLVSAGRVPKWLPAFLHASISGSGKLMSPQYFKRNVLAGLAFAASVAVVVWAVLFVWTSRVAIPQSAAPQLAVLATRPPQSVIAPAAPTAPAQTTSTP